MPTRLAAACTPGSLRHGRRLSLRSQCKIGLPAEVAALCHGSALQPDRTSGNHFNPCTQHCPFHEFPVTGHARSGRQADAPMPDRMTATMRYRPSSSKSTQVGRSMISTVLLKARLWCGVVRPCNPGMEGHRKEGLSMVGRQSTLPLASTSKWVANAAAVHVARERMADNNFWRQAVASAKSMQGCRNLHGYTDVPLRESIQEGAGARCRRHAVRRGTRAGAAWGRGETGSAGSLAPPASATGPSSAADSCTIRS